MQKSKINLKHSNGASKMEPSHFPGKFLFTMCQSSANLTIFSTIINSIIRLLQLNYGSIFLTSLSQFFNHLISRIFLKEENLLRHFRVTYAFRDMTSTTKRRVGISKVNLTLFQD